MTDCEFDTAEDYISLADKFQRFKMILQLLDTVKSIVRFSVGRQQSHRLHHLVHSPTVRILLCYGVLWGDNLSQ